jgi:hypothetical protein
VAARPLRRLGVLFPDPRRGRGRGLWPLRGLAAPNSRLSLRGASRSHNIAGRRFAACRFAVARRHVGAAPSPAQASVHWRSPLALRAHCTSRLGLPLFPRVGFFGGAGCPFNCETQPAPPKKLRAEGRGGSRGNLLFRTKRGSALLEVEREAVARSSARRWRGRAGGEVEREAVLSSSGRARRGPEVERADEFGTEKPGRASPASTTA